MKWSQSQALSNPSSSNSRHRSTNVCQGRFWSVTIPNRTAIDGIIPEREVAFGTLLPNSAFSRITTRTAVSDGYPYRTLKILPVAHQADTRLYVHLALYARRTLPGRAGDPRAAAWHPRSA